MLVLQALQPLMLAVVAVSAGGCVVVQQAFNASLRADLGSAFWAAFVSYAGGALTLAVVMVALREPWIVPTLTKGSLCSWAGGAFGTVYIVTSIMLLPRLGAMTVIALLIVGQMLASLVFDHFGLFGLEQRPIDIYRAIGAVLLVVSVILVRA
jgi:bacterial/archaeal transporter family-2 protein